MSFSNYSIQGIMDYPGTIVCKTLETGSFITTALDSDVLNLTLEIDSSNNQTYAMSVDPSTRQLSLIGSSLAAPVSYSDTVFDVLGTGPAPFTTGYLVNFNSVQAGRATIAAGSGTGAVITLPFGFDTSTGVIVATLCSIDSTCKSVVVDLNSPGSGQATLVPDIPPTNPVSISWWIPKMV